MGIFIPPQSLFQNPLLMIDGAAAAPAYTFASNPNTGFYSIALNAVGVALAGSSVYSFNTTGFTLGGTRALDWGSSGVSAPDLFLFRDAANTLAQRNGVNAQTLRVYNTFTDASNYERGTFDWSSTGNVLSIGTQNAGTGSARAINFLIGGSAKWQISTAGFLVAVSDNTFDIGASGAFRPRDYFGAGSGTFGANITLGATGNLTFLGRTKIRSGADGSLQLGNNGNTDFGLLQFGGTTSSFPALKRSTTILQARLADDSAFAPMQGMLRTDTNATTGLVAGTLAATTNASIVVYDASGQAYRIPVII